MTSVLNVDTIADKAGTGPVGLTKQSPAKIWANIFQHGAAVRGTLGLSSVTDQTGGDVSINFASAFDSTDNYAVNGTTGSNGSAPDHYVTGPDSNRTYSTSTVGLNLMNFNGSLNDQNVLWIAVHGDLA